MIDIILVCIVHTNIISFLFREVKQWQKKLIYNLQSPFKIAKEKIKPNQVKDLVLKTLVTNGYIMEDEEDIYELYAIHIKNLITEKE